jgi:plastocyanin
MRRRRRDRPSLAPVVLVCVLPLLGACASAADEDASQRRYVTDASVVSMRLIAFRPDELGVAAHTKVTWTQRDAGFHTVTSGTAKSDASGAVRTDPDGTFASGRLARGKRFTFTFDEPGAYRYFCEIHPATMRGLVTVDATSDRGTEGENG